MANINVYLNCESHLFSTHDPRRPDTHTHTAVLTHILSVRIACGGNQKASSVPVSKKANCSMSLPPTRKPSKLMEQRRTFPNVFRKVAR